MIIDGNVDYKGVLVGSSASISSMNAIQGISVGANSVGSGTIVFSNSNNVSFGLSQGIITMSTSGGTTTGASYATGFQWPPLQGWNAITRLTVNSGTVASTGGSTQTTVSFSVAPVVVPYAISYNAAEGLVVPSFAAGTGSVTVGLMYGIYTLTGNTLSLQTSYNFVERMSRNSATNHSHRWNWGTDSAANSSSSGGNISTLFSGTRQINIGTGVNSIPPGNMWILVGETRSVSSTDVFQQSSFNFFNADTTGNLTHFYGLTDSQNLFLYQGCFSSTSNDTATGVNMIPSSFNVSILSRTDGINELRVPWIRFFTS
jgi:hypothetical protein